jgi:AcrR family transcriptional regulator
MPRGFTPQEMELIRKKLLDAGRVCLEKYGVRKTNVEDLTRAAGISKGAFYKFFDSKEALLFEVLERFEDEYRIELKKRMDNFQGNTAKEQVRSLISESFKLYWQDPLFQFLNPQEYEVLLRKLPQDVVEEHMASDDVFVSELVTMWNQRGIHIHKDTYHVSALIKSLFYTSLHAEEIGPAFPPAFETLIDLVADHLVEE